MVVIAVVAVLASLAIYGVRRYLSTAKAAEAKQIVGKIARSAQASFERELAPSEDTAEGSMSTSVSHALCGTAQPVPAFVPQGKKYQPITSAPLDFQTGDDRNGWRCLQFNVTQPIYFQYQYTKDQSLVAPSNPAACNADCYEAGAMGDTNANGVFSRFALTGVINTNTGAMKTATQIYSENEAE
jgi:type IV pilus assembly protein PilA